MNPRLIWTTTLLLSIAALPKAHAALERQMYALYGLTEAEVKIVEGAAK